jgi:acyl carrier protein
MTVATVLPELRPLVARLAPAGGPTPLLDDHLLGAHLGFDSVLLFELLLDCEERFAVSLAAETLLDGDISTRGLAEAIASAR